jgi:hypothetical protein
MRLLWGVGWSEASRPVKVLTIALMRAVGGAALALSVLQMAVLLGSFQSGDVWAFWALPISTLVISASSIRAMVIVSTNTPAKPPLVIVLTASCLSLIGLVLSFL